MKTITNDYKREITTIGRQYKNKINIYENIYLTTEDNKLILTQNDMKLIVGVSDTIEKTIIDDVLFNITLSRKTRILATAMKELDFESYEDIRVGNIIEYEFGLKTGNEYIQTTDITYQSNEDYYELDDNEYVLLEQGVDYQVGDTITETIYNNQDIYEWVNYGKYIVYSKEFNEDTKTYSYVCYDNMLKSMVSIDNETKIDNVTIKEAIINMAKRFKYNIIETGKNLFKLTDFTISEGTTATMNNGEITISNWSQGFNLDISDAITLDNNKTYTISFKHKGNELKLRNKSVGSTNILDIGTDTNYKEYSITLSNISGFQFRFIRGVNNGTAYLKDFQIEEGSTATYYERYYNIDEDYVNLTKTIADGTFTNIDNTYRDVLDMICQAIGTTMILDNNDLYFKSLQQPPVDTIGKEFLKDSNVSFGKKYGPINSLVLSKGDNADIEKKDTNSIKENGSTIFKIKDNLILNGDDRSTYMDGIFNQINGTEFYLNDISSTGIGYIELMDYYNISIDENNYKCLMLESNYKVKSGISEEINSEQPEETDTEFSTSTKSTKDVTMEINQQKNDINNKINRNEVIFSINNTAEETTINNNRLNMIIENNEENLKNIEEYSNALQKVYNTDIYEFNYLSEQSGAKKTIGFIRGNTQYTDDIVGTKDGYTGANLFSMVSVLWQGVKELEAGGVDIPQQDTAPENPSEDDLWIDTSEDGMIPIDSVELYNDTTGSNTTVTLNQNASNFSYLEIFYRSNDSIYGSTKIYSPNGKTFNVTMVRSTGSATASNTYLKTADFNISGTSITIGNYGEILYQTNGNFSINANSNIYITRVVGIE